MKLNEAVQKAIDYCGVEVLKTERLVNLLTDFQAFDEMRFAKNILKNIYANKFGEQIYNAYTQQNGGENIDKMIYQFSNNLGFSEAKIRLVLTEMGVIPQSIEEVEEEAIVEQSSPENNTTQAASYPPPYNPPMNPPIYRPSNFYGSEIASKVKAIIVDKLGVDEAEVTDSASFTNDLGADSLDTVELVMQFEKEFGVTIPDDQAEKITNVGEAIAFIEQNAR